MGDNIHGKITEDEAKNVQTVDKESITRFIERNIRLIQYTVIGVGCIGVLLITRAVRLASKFESSKSIPLEFYDKHITLYGKMNTMWVDDEQRLLLGVDHTPILDFARMQGAREKAQSAINERLLSIIVAGIQIQEQYLPVIHSKVINPNVKVTLLARCEKSNKAYAIVGFKSTKYKVFTVYSDMGTYCLKNGFGNALSLQAYKQIFFNRHFLSVQEQKYYENLLSKQNYAQHKGMGIWKDVSQVKSQKTSKKYFFTPFKQLLKLFKK